MKSETLPESLPENFTNLTVREVQIAIRFAIDVLKAIGDFPLPVGFGEDAPTLYTPPQMALVAIGRESAVQMGLEVVLPMLGQSMLDERTLCKPQSESESEAPK